jgi:hypothetical protein
VRDDGVARRFCDLLRDFAFVDRLEGRRFTRLREPLAMSESFTNYGGALDFLIDKPHINALFPGKNRQA